MSLSGNNRSAQRAGGFAQFGRHQSGPCPQHRFNSGPVFHDATVEDDSVGLDGGFKVFQALLEPCSPGLERQVLLRPDRTGEVLFQQPSSGGVWPSSILQIGNQLTVFVDRRTETCTDG